MQNLDSAKFHTMTPKLKKNLIILAAIFIFVILPIASFQYYKFAINRPAQGFRGTYFEIKEGEAISSISGRLYTENLVNSAFLFKFYLLTSGSHTTIQAGVYNVPPGASIVQLGDIFQHGTNDISVTFLEGWRVEEFAAYAAERFDKVDYDTFLNLAQSHEGYLFPDTYYFRSDASEEAIISRLTSTFESKTAGLLTDESLSAAGLTREEAVIFASIVEREVFNPEDRPIVAGILIKRYKNGELIGADATTQYAVGTESNWWPQQLFVQDLNSESPYNTRRVVGLPPTPIASPGLGAIDAVLRARITPYNYYLTDENGITHYATTLEEHNQNVFLHL